jgi:arginyl-tRNA synthetase
MLLEQIAETARLALAEITGGEAPPVTVDVPEDAALGDFTVNCFHLAKTLRRPPPALAAELAPKLAGRGPIDAAVAASGYVNVKVKREALFAAALPLADAPDRDAPVALHRGRKLLVEFSAPNTNKPQHLGHLRNNFLGDSVSRLLAYAGAEVHKVNLINDRGIHICKSMLAYRKFGGGTDPVQAGLKGDHLVGRFYVEFEKAFQSEVDAYVASHEAEFQTWRAANALDKKGRPREEAALRKEWRDSFKEEGFGKIPLGAEAQQMLRSWEQGDAETVALWRKMNGWVFAGFDATYRRLGIAFDKIYYESDTYTLGRDLILEGLARGVFARRADGAVEIDLSAHGLGKKVVLRSDGTSVYITQDIGTTVLKAREFSVDGQIWVVADEQKFHFQTLFKILESLGYPWASRLHHLAYGLVNLPEGRMKSREGTVVDADNLYDEVAGLAAAEIAERDAALPEDEVRARAERIAGAALKFMLLKVTPAATMIYNPKESVSFVGETGPYLLYTYARIRRMLDEGGDAGAADPAALGHPSEASLAVTLLRFGRAAERAAREYNPAAVCQYLIQLAQAYNTYYQDVPVLKAADARVRAARLKLSGAAAAILRRGLELLGVPVLERM